MTASNTFRNPWCPSSEFLTLFGLTDNRSPQHQLDTPTILTIQQTQDEDYKAAIIVSPIIGATSFRLFENGTPVATSETTTIHYEFIKNGDYIITVRAYGTGYKPSQHSAARTITVTNLGSHLFSGLRFITNGLKRILLRK